MFHHFRKFLFLSVLSMDALLPKRGSSVYAPRSNSRFTFSWSTLWGRHFRWTLGRFIIWPWPRATLNLCPWHRCCCCCSLIGRWRGWSSFGFCTSNCLCRGDTTWSSQIGWLREKISFFLRKNLGGLSIDMFCPWVFWRQSHIQCALSWGGLFRGLDRFGHGGQNIPVFFKLFLGNTAPRYTVNLKATLKFSTGSKMGFNFRLWNCFLTNLNYMYKYEFFKL